MSGPERDLGAIREREFDCVECGQHIVRFASLEGELDLCAHCLFVPGWHRSPELRKIIAPEGLPDMPAREREPVDLAAAVHEPRRQAGPLKAQFRFLRVLGRPFRRAPRILGK
jgi:Zn-finger nucleic acid-binding protein